jgi:hypothetical protein
MADPLDPAAFECLAPWFMFNADDIIPAHPLHPFNQFLINIMDIQVAYCPGLPFHYMLKFILSSLL